MLAWIIRAVLFVAGPIAALFVSRDALNFGVVETLVAVVLMRDLLHRPVAHDLERRFQFLRVYLQRQLQLVL